MKIGIVTFHFAFNQGAVLQCYAMQKYLESLGHEAYVINYRPRYHTVMHSAWRNPFVYAHVFWKKFRNRSTPVRLYLTAKSFVRSMCWNITGIDKNSQAAFRRFEKNHLHLTREYKTLKELQDTPPEMNAYISGSDQVWNPELLGGEFDKAYFLDFGGEETKRITYAVSMGKIHDAETLSQLRELCKDLDAISLREYSKEDIAAVGRDVHICVDPTLLLEAADYSDIESEAVEEAPYIFVYGFETNELLRDAIEEASKKYNCKIVNGSPKWLHLNGDVKTVSGYGPDRFVSLIKNAECIITNSFHGTAFSIIYKKSFITVPHSTRGKRMEDLLGKLGLSYRLFGRVGFSLDKTINYAEVYEKLNILKTHSKEYLKLSLAGCRGENIPHYQEEVEGCDIDNPKKLNAYYGYYCDDAKLKESASGGVASALSEQILKEKGVVFGVVYSDDFKRAEFQCIERMEDLKKLKGSKYIAPSTLINGKLVFDIVGEKLIEGKRVLFIGSGCHIGALLKRLEKSEINTRNLYTVDIICHGPTIQTVYDAFISSLEGKYHSKIVSVNMRHKKHGWIPPYLYIQFENGRTYIKPLYETDLGFALRICVRESCYQCHYKGNSHLADITIGDFWGLKPGMKEYNTNGVSAMLSRSEKGEQLIKELDQSVFYVGQTEADKVIMHNRMYKMSLKKADYVDQFVTDLKEKSLHYAVTHSKGYPAFVKLAVRNRIKGIVGMR